MPFQGQAVQGGDFVDRFLDVVFAKGGLAGGMGLPNGILPPGFGNGQQTHTARGTACCKASRLNLSLDMRQIFCNQSIHGLSVPKPLKSPTGQLKTPRSSPPSDRLLN